MRAEKTRLYEKLKEAWTAVWPVMAIVLFLSFTAVPLSPGILLCFLMGSLLLIAGMMFFTLGAELAMSPMGERVGSSMSRCRNPLLLGALTFFLGFMITISEPDLQVLAELVPAVPNWTLILSVALGVGVFLVAALLRMLFGIALAHVLIICYLAVFILSGLVPESFLAVAFDSGGVTTGPMTVPFIMALGVGVSAIRDDSRASNDSFGLVSLCSIGPILAVLILSLIYRAEGSEYVPAAVPVVESSVELWRIFQSEIPKYMKEIALSLLPVVLFFGLFQAAVLRMQRKPLLRIGVGLVYTYVGLVLFLTGANAGFMPAGTYLGNMMASAESRFMIIPVGMVIGFFIVKAEPAVYVLNRQVEDLTDGAVTASAMGAALSVGVAVSVGIAMIRVLTGISVLYFLVPGYVLALGLSFFVPKLFTAIAFDSGGVASGPMTATFLLPFAQGACMAAGGDVVRDAFGVVAMVAMTPLITIQVLGIVYQLRSRRARKSAVLPAALADMPASGLELLADDDIIEL